MFAWSHWVSHGAVSPDCSAAVSAAWLLCPPPSLRHGGCLIEKIISLNTNIFYHDLIYWKTSSFDREKNRINRGKMCVAMYYMLWIIATSVMNIYLLLYICSHRGSELMDGRRECVKVTLLWLHRGCSQITSLDHRLSSRLIIKVEVLLSNISVKLMNNIDACDLWTDRLGFRVWRI